MEKGYKTLGFWAVLAATLVAGATASGAIGEPSMLGSILATAGSALGAAGYASFRAFQKGKDGKPAWKTTEFWLTGAAAAVGIAAASGMATSGVAAQVVGVATTILAAIGYGVRHSLPPVAQK